MSLAHAQPSIYLASQSPRRRELLQLMGVEFSVLCLRNCAVRGPDVSEAVLPAELPDDYVVRVAREKALFAAKMVRLRKLPPHAVLAADTTVALDAEILGKPADPEDARTMLAKLSGRTHRVLTCVALATQNDCWHLLQDSQVEFARLDARMIDAYCATGEPFDKAGAYGVQGKAALFIRQITGSHSGIMGLPIFETAQLLTHAGITLP